MEKIDPINPEFDFGFDSFPSQDPDDTTDTGTTGKAVEKLSVPEVDNNGKEGNFSTISEEPKGKKQIRRSPRVAVSLVSNLSAPVATYEELKGMYNSSEIVGHRNEKGEVYLSDFERDVLRISKSENVLSITRKPVDLTNQEQKLCFALCFLLAREYDNPTFESLVRQTEEGSSKPLFFPIRIDAKELSKIMTGESRTKFKNKVGELLKSISKKDQILQSKINVHGKNETYFFTFPLIQNNGFVEKEVIDKDGNVSKEFVGMNAGLFRPFFDNIRKKNVPLHSDIFRLWIDSSLFSNIFSKVCELWFYSFVGFKKAKNDVLQKYGKNIQTSKISEIEEEIKKLQYSRITQTIDFETLDKYSGKNYLQGKDGNERKKKVYRFKKELEKILSRLIEYKIITNHSRIIPDKKQILFVFNMNFCPEGTVTELPEGTTSEDEIQTT